MKTPAVIKIKTLPFCSLLVVAGIVLTTGRALAANTNVWNGGNFVSVTTNWSDTANWLPVGTPGSADTAVFGATGTGTDGVTVNNALTANTTVAGLQYTNTTSGTWHVTQIPAGTTLTVAGTMLVGGGFTNNGLVTSVAFVDAGTLVVTTGNLSLGNSGTSSTDTGTLDLSGLTNFVYNNSSGTINIGFNNRSAGNWKLASGSNSVTAATWNPNNSSTSTSASGTVTLGAGTNIFNVGTINAAASRNNSTIQFPAGGGAGLRLRGVGGTDTDRTTLVLANRNQNTSGGNNTGTFNFNGNAVDMKFSTMTLGEGTAATPSASQSGIAVINFDTGIIDATTINMAISTANANNIGKGTINVGSAATLVVSNLSMVNQGPLATGASVGALNVSGGTVNCSGSIFKTTTAGTGTITMTGGKLNVNSGSIGSATNALDTFSLSDATLTLPSGLVASAYATNLVAGGTANTINVTSVPSFFSYPAQFPVISYATAGGDNNTFVVGTLPGTFTGYISNNVGNLSIDIVITNGPALATLKSIRWNGTPTGDWTTNTSTLNWLTNSTAVNYNQGDTVTFDDSLAGTPNVNLTQTLTPGGLNVSNSVANYLFSGIGKISGSTGLTKTGTGTLILDNSGTNDFVGAISIANGGTLQVGNNDANGNLPGGGWDVEGTLAFSRSDNVVISTVFSGAGSLVQNGSGKLSLNAAETYSGNTVIRKGTLALTGGGSIANTALISVQNGAFDVSATPPSTAINPISMTNGTLIVDTNNISTSALSVTNSTIRLVANAQGASIVATTLTMGGATNYVNVTGVQNVASPAIFPIITYSSLNGGFNMGLTNFPNAYITNDTTANAIELVLTATPYVVTWNGGSLTGNNWSDSNNWSGVSIFANDSLFFDGSTRLNPVNDTAAGTTYSNITFNGSASSFTLTGNPITLSGGIFNNSGNPQAINLGLSYNNNNVSFNGTGGLLNIGGGLTNTHGSQGFTTNTFTGTGILTNLLSSTSNGTNLFLVNDASANWTLMDNATSATNTVPWAFAFNNGTFNIGSASSAPKLVSTSGQGVPQDNQLGNSATAVLNLTNGTFTTTARLNTGAGSGNGTINQYGGTFNIGSQFQGANGSGTASSTVNLYGGTMNIGSATNATGQFYVASRGSGVLTVTNSALLNCGILDISRNASGTTAASVGVVNLDGGAIRATRVGTATANSQSGTPIATAMFSFNGGTLIAGASSGTFFQGSTAAPVIPITAIVTARGAIIDSGTNTIGFLEPLLTDPNLLGAPDGGLKKLGTGTLTLTATNTYIGDTLVGAGTLLVNGIQGQSRVIVSNNATLGGNGVIGSNVTVNAGGAVSPGNNGVGTLTVAGDVSLAGTTTMEIDKVGATNDLLLATNVTPSTITYSGTLNIVTVTGSLAPGDTFKLFSASNYVGSFAVINPPSVTWNTNNLNVDGTLTVVSVAPAGPTTNATITKVTLSGTNLLVHGTNNNVPNNTLHYVVLTSTNIATPLTNWSPVVTNIYNNDGTFDFTNPVVPGTVRQFIDVKAVQ